MAATTQNTRLEVKAPSAGQVVVLPAVPGQDFILEAAFDQAEIRMDGGNVVFEFAGGGRVVLDFTDLGEAEAPGIVMPDGTILNMQEFLAALGESEVEPAAGPEGGTDGSGGVGEYRDDAGNLLDGVDRLDGFGPREFASIFVESLEADVLAEADLPPADVPPADVPPADVPDEEEGNDIPIARNDPGRVEGSFEVPEPLPRDISNVLFLVKVGDSTVAYKIDYPSSLETRDPGHPLGFIEWIERETGGTVEAYYIKAGTDNPNSNSGGGFFDSLGNRVDPVEEGLEDYLAGNDGTFGENNITPLPGTPEYNPDGNPDISVTGFTSGNVLDNDTGEDLPLSVLRARQEGADDDAWDSLTEDGVAEITTAYGVLKLYPDGSYEYELKNWNESAQKDVFEYEITDVDGDTASAFLTIEFDVVQNMLTTNIEVA